MCCDHLAFSAEGNTTHITPHIAYHSYYTTRHTLGIRFCFCRYEKWNSLGATQCMHIFGADAPFNKGRYPHAPSWCPLCPCSCEANIFSILFTLHPPPSAFLHSPLSGLPPRAFTTQQAICPSHIPLLLPCPTPHPGSSGNLQRRPRSTYWTRRHAGCLAPLPPSRPDTPSVAHLQTDTSPFNLWSSACLASVPYITHRVPLLRMPLGATLSCASQMPGSPELATPSPLRVPYANNYRFAKHMSNGVSCPYSNQPSELYHVPRALPIAVLACRAPAGAVGLSVKRCSAVASVQSASVQSQEIL